MNAKQELVKARAEIRGLNAEVNRLNNDLCLYQEGVIEQFGNEALKRVVVAVTEKKQRNKQIKSLCPACGGSDLFNVYEARTPVFQNVAFDSFDAAISAPKRDIRIVRCASCSFVFNAAFDPSIVRYGSDYQNEQANSPVFQRHLAYVINVIKHAVGNDGKVVEVGCGKGRFLEMLIEAGIDAIGYDPAYEGVSPRVVKENFGLGCHTNAKMIVLRHVLEHVSDPVAFLSTIADANGRKGDIYIEVPDFTWIVNNGAFWDLFHEHCNYFTISTLAGLFTVSATGELFGGQYIYARARLADLRGRVEARPGDGHYSGFAPGIEKRYADLLGMFPGRAVVWGAAAKGSTFVNRFDPLRRHIKYLVDVNPAKQGKFVGGTGHRIVAPAEFLADGDVDLVLVMNNNYTAEVVEAIGSKKCIVIAIPVELEHVAVATNKTGGN